MKKLINEYFKILSPDYPKWLDDYINTKRMQKQKYVNTACGKMYTKLFNEDCYSNLDHSIGVALIIYNFTHEKKQTIAGLFHDIATPAFKHCIDFLNGDYIKQESTEELTKYFIKESNDIMALLKNDHLTPEDVDDYQIYPIADNHAPKLSADRLEYTLANALIVFKIINLDDVKRIYQDIEIEVNEDGIIELGFKTKKIAREFVKISSTLSLLYRDDATRFYMQAVADILKKVSSEGLINKNDLYELKESEVIDIINKSSYKDVWQALCNATKVNVSREKPDCYFVKHPTKVRYIDPLCNGKRISSICKIAKKMIDNNLLYQMDNYVYINDIFNVLND